MTKDNNYRGIGTGDGRNRIAILDPAGTSPDSVLASVAVMRTAGSVLDPTPLPGTGGATYAIANGTLYAAGP